MNNIYGGLKRTTEDKRDLKYGAFFKLPNLSELPASYRVENPFGLKDQGSSDLCTGYAGTYASEIQEGVELSPEYQYAKSCQLRGNFEEWGMEIRTMLKSLTTFGSLPAHRVPDQNKLSESNRDFVANWKNWAAELDVVAKEYRKGSYLSVAGQYDLFDDIRATLWAERAEKRIAITGALWRPEWTASDGFIPREPLPDNEAFGHAFVFEGWETIEGEPWLVAHLSNGTAFGDNGHFYFPREVVNRECPFAGAYTLKDISPEVLKEADKLGMQRFLRIVALWLRIKNMLKYS